MDNFIINIYKDFNIKKLWRMKLSSLIDKNFILTGDIFNSVLECVDTFIDLFDKRNISKDASIIEAVVIMTDKGFRHLPVIDNKTVVGIISETDILKKVIILVSVELGVRPIPYIISAALASNIGGMATLIGDPPNIMIGSAAILMLIAGGEEVEEFSHEVEWSTIFFFIGI